MPSVAILAGGRARRFGGRDKSRLIVEGRTIIERQIAQLSQVSDDVMRVGAAGADAPPGVRVVADRMPSAGPLGGLDAALAAAEDRLVVLVACDMPFITAELIRLLLSRAEGADAVVPKTERGYHPLCAVYARECGPVVAQALAEGRLKMIELLRQLRVAEVQSKEIERLGPCARLLANVNSPVEFEELGALPGHKL